MTVFASSYCSLEEAWADPYAPQQPSSRKSRRSRHAQPTSSGGHTDIEEFASKYLPHGKEDKPVTNKYVDIYESDFAKKEKSQVEDDVPQEEFEPTRPSTPLRKKRNIEYYDDDDTEYYADSPRSNEEHFMDFLLFLLSGVILIFMMEQFVRIGGFISMRNF